MHRAQRIQLTINTPQAEPQRHRWDGELYVVLFRGNMHFLTGPDGQLVWCMHAAPKAHYCDLSR